jgi:GNAT superfamily N-acetyltransferase
LRREQASLRLRTIGRSDADALEAAYNLLAKHAWSAEEITNIDLRAELRETCEHRVGLYSSDRLVGFAAVATGASPDKKDNDQLWIGYLVVHPSFRRGRGFLKLCEDCVEFAVDRGGGRRIFACTESKKVERALARAGWRHVRTAEILGDAEQPLGETTEVYEYMPTVSVGPPTPLSPSKNP